MSIRLVLASGSPRRARALRTLGVDFVVEPPDIDETQLPGETPEDMVLRLALEKAGEATTSEVRLAVDTTVVLAGEVVGKPQDPTAAVNGLLALADRTHEVVSGWAVVSDGHTASGIATSLVRMRHIDRNEAVAYVATGEPLDKAGSYAIQGFGSRFVSRVTGSPSNVKGFPAETIVPELVLAGVRVPRVDAELLRIRSRPVP